MPPPPPSQRRYVCPCKVCKKDPRQKQTVPTINAHRNRDRKAQEAAKFRALVPLAIATQRSNNLAGTRSNGAVDNARMTSIESVGRLGGLEVHDEARSGGMSCGSQAPRRTVFVEDGSDDDLDNEFEAPTELGDFFDALGQHASGNDDSDNDGSSGVSDTADDPQDLAMPILRPSSPATDTSDDEFFDVAEDDPLYASREDIYAEQPEREPSPPNTGRAAPALREHPLVRRAYVEAFIAVAFHGATHDLAQYLLESAHATLSGLSQDAGYDIPGLDHMALTLRTVERRLGLDPDEHITYYAVCNLCWDCHHPLELGDLPSHGRCLQLGCSGKVFDIKRYTDGHKRRIPVKVLATTSPKAAIQRILLRPSKCEDFNHWRSEDDAVGAKAPVDEDDWPGSLDDEFRMYDMSDGWGWNAIRAGLKRRRCNDNGAVDVDVKELNQRFVALPNGLVLIFNLDWFRALKRGNYSVGAIYLTICNNPRSKRFLREETFLLTVIPGPDEPSLEQLNNILEIFVPELLELYEGVNMAIAGRAVPEPVNCYLYVNTSDLPAARKASGLRGHTSKWFMCPVCKQPLHSLTHADCFDPAKVEYRNEQRLLRWAYRARDQDSATREEIAEVRGVRWSALNDLPDWWPIMDTPTEFMHAGFLGEAKHVVQGILTVGGMFAKRSQRDNPLKKFEAWIDACWWPSSIGRVPKGLITAGSGKADQWRNMVAILPPGLYEAWQVNGEIPDQDAPPLRAKQKMAIKAKRVAELVKERRQAAAAYEPGTTAEDLEYIEQTTMRRNYRDHFAVVLEWCTAMRIWASQSISVAEARRAQACHNHACQTWATMFCHLTPYFHLLIHFIVYLLRLGPVYGWWVFPFERYNGWLAKVNHNGHKGGELEATMMRSWMKLHLIYDLILQLEALGDDKPAQDERNIQDLKKCLKGEKRERQSRGTLLSSIAMMTADESKEFIRYPRRSHKTNLRANGLYALIYQHLRELWKASVTLIPDTSYAQQGSPFVAINVPFYSHVHVAGQRYGASSTHRGQADRFAYVNGREAVEITHIMRCQHTTQDNRILFADLAVVKPFIASPEASHLPWNSRSADLGIDVWKFKQFGAQYVVNLQQLSGHFAMNTITFKRHKLTVTMSLCHDTQEPDRYDGLDNVGSL